MHPRVLLASSGSASTSTAQSGLSQANWGKWQSTGTASLLLASALGMQQPCEQPRPFARPSPMGHQAGSTHPHGAMATSAAAAEETPHAAGPQAGPTIAEPLPPAGCQLSSQAVRTLPQMPLTVQPPAWRQQQQQPVAAAKAPQRHTAPTWPIMGNPVLGGSPPQQHRELPLGMQGGAVPCLGQRPMLTVPRTTATTAVSQAPAATRLGGGHPDPFPEQLVLAQAWQVPVVAATLPADWFSVRRNLFCLVFPADIHPCLARQLPKVWMHLLQGCFKDLQRTTEELVKGKLQAQRVCICHNAEAFTSGFLVVL